MTGFTLAPVAFAGLAEQPDSAREIGQWRGCPVCVLISIMRVLATSLGVCNGLAVVWLVLTMSTAVLTAAPTSSSVCRDSKVCARVFWSMSMPWKRPQVVVSM